MPTIRRTNSITNPSAEVNTTGWSSFAATLTRDTGSFSQGTASFKMVMTGAANPFLANASVVAAPGDIWRFAVDYKTSGTLSNIYALKIQAKDAGSAVLATYTTALPATQAAFARFIVTTPALPATTTQITALILATGTPAASETFWMDGTLLVKGTAMTDTTYFDGATTATAQYTYAWTGAANASTSTETWINNAPPFAPVLVGHTDAAPCPRVDVSIAPMPPDAVKITVYRSWAGRQRAIRGGDHALVSGDYITFDYEVPLGILVSYTVVSYDVNGVASAASDPATVTVNATDIWAQDPLSPNSAMPVSVGGPGLTSWKLEDMFGQLSYSSDVAMAGIVGSDLPSAIGAIRQRASKIPIAIYTEDATASAFLRELLLHTFPLCLRTPARYGFFDGLLYLSAPTITEIPARRTGESYSVWVFEADNVLPPGLAIIVPVRVYDDLKDEAATYSALKALYATYNDLKRG